jgi:hypothetical protein
MIHFVSQSFGKKRNIGMSQHHVGAMTHPIDILLNIAPIMYTRSDS